jgi:diguanylate cyclase (GGDEF)-like protein
VPLLDGCQLARLGGDEFAFVSFASSAEHIDRIAATLTAAAGHLAKIDRGVVAPTVSIGLAPFNAGADLSAVLATADAALYRAKSGGRNCVCVAASHRETGEMPTAQSPLLGR